MRNQHYPITTMGVLKLCRRIIEIVESDLQHDEVKATFLPEKKQIDGRPCTVLEMVHPERRPHFRFHLARVYVDDGYRMPVRYEAYDWPAEEGGEPALIEQYTYTDLKLNQGFGDIDFDPKNPAYKFPQ